MQVSLIKDMLKATDCSLCPLNRCKILHMVRHAQGYHNEAAEKDHEAYKSVKFFDARLTPVGWQQVEGCRREVTNSGIASRIELVVTSPLTRAMQTAAGVFGGGDYIVADPSPPLMDSVVGKTDHTAISSSNCPPFMAVELCREKIGQNPCDKRKHISEYKTLFPGIDFSLIKTDEDVLWKPNTREQGAEVAARGKDFINWLLTRKEKEIAVVSHSAFFKETLDLFGNDCHPLVKDEITKEFANCELRSFVVCDRSAICSTSVRVTNFSGHIPPVPDVPNHYDGEKNMENIIFTLL